MPNSAAVSTKTRRWSTSVRLDDAALQLGDVVVGQLGQQFGGACRQPPRLEIDKVKLLFDTQRSRRHVSHPPTVWATSYRRVKH
jgi:hypothetical protein